MSEPNFTNPQFAAGFLSDVLAEMEQSRHVDAWLLEVALDAVRQLDADGKAASVLQALADRMECAASMHLARGTASRLVELLDRGARS